MTTSLSIRFISNQHLASYFECLRFTMAGNEVIKLKTVLAKMGHLKLVQLPNMGWSDSATRNHLVKFLQNRQVSVCFSS